MGGGGGKAEKILEKGGVKNEGKRGKWGGWCPPLSFLRGKIKKKSAKWPNEGFFFKVAPHTPWGRKEGGKEAKKKSLKNAQKKKKR